MLHNKNRSEYELHVMIAGGVTFLLGAIAVAGRATGKDFLTSLNPEYVPMSAASAFSALGFGFVLLSWQYWGHQKILRSVSLGIVLIISFYCLLKTDEFFNKPGFSVDDYLFPDLTLTNKPGSFIPLNRIPPFAALLFFLSGISILLSYLKNKGTGTVTLAGSLGMIVSLTGFATTLGYIEGKPLLCGSDRIPLSLPSSLVMLFLGAGLVFLAGERSILLKFVSGQSSSARLLRGILPLLLVAILIDNILEVILSQFFIVNIPLLLAVLSIFLIAVTVFLAIRITRLIFRDAEIAEAARVRAVEALKESEKKHRLIIENQGEGIGLVDTEERFIYVNPAAEKIFGVNPGTLANRNLMEFLRPESVNKILQETKTRSQDIPSSYEIEIVTPGQEHRVILVTASPQFDNNGKFIGTFGVFRDISARKLAEAKLIVFNEELTEVNATKDKFFSIIAHDLRNPFNLLLGYSNILTEEIENNHFGEALELSHRIHSVSKSTYSLLENLLTWSQLQTRNISFSKETFILGEILSPELKLMTAMAEGKNIKLVSKIGNTIEMNADKDMISTVIRNLVSNAIKFTKPGGMVTLSSETADHEIIFSVSDTGTGMSKEEVSQLFIVSKTISKPGTAKEKGTGLGLILCKEFVTLHGGNIMVTSEPGQGSRFSFTIPA
jgi:PAS domain S-box-containing protein